MKLITYVNSIIELDMMDLAIFAITAQGENRHVTWLKPDMVAGYDHLEQGVVIIWEGDADTHVNEIRDAFREQWELDIIGEGPGLSG